MRGQTDPCFRNWESFLSIELADAAIRPTASRGGIETLNAGDPIPNDECIPSTFPINGDATPVTPGQTIEYVVPDIYGRPWARIWEQYHEHGMARPAADDIFDFGR